MAIPIVMPRLGDFMTEGIVTRFTKTAGDSVTQGEVIAEIETEKVNYDLEATNSGVFHPVVDQGDTVLVDDVMGYLLEEGELPPKVEKTTDKDAANENITSAPKRSRETNSNRKGAAVPSTPGARKLAAKLGIDLEKVVPTGPRGRVVEADVKALAEVPVNSKPQTPQGLPRPISETPLQGMRKSIAANMRNSLADTAQLSYFLEVDVTEAQNLRREQGLGMAEFLIKATSEALIRVPTLNSVLVGDSILKFDRVNMAFAVALDDGLVVPVIRESNSKSIQEISKEVKSLSEAAKNSDLGPDDFMGGTFTISILGSVDGFTPILNQAQVGLLGVGRSLQKPVVRDGEVVVREMMTLSLTGDHQVVDGAVAASFFRRLQRLIESPAKLFS
ncbi:MAG: dihydrolipoamide acetyltransferase family protein [Chloroflexota bacterium]|nr:dihydrolipoamide acetyltransferase family protein [Chloroflexota bacterium]MED5450374.1 dihydrolipoamide acetyltransferase family protein [Chloroflexota bacterium]MED6296188.1 dihydrolipoamide acetyltransferase family protein [Chloroflexota bacterium]